MARADDSTPTAAERELLRIFGLEARDDYSVSYLRWHCRHASCGLVWMPHQPQRWGVYWGGSHDLESMAWCATLTTALSVMVRMA